MPAMDGQWRSSSIDSVRTNRKKEGFRFLDYQMNYYEVQINRNRDYDYLCEISLKENVATDKGNGRNEL